MEQNPALVQTAPSSQEDAAPLILIHDGGGTTFSYHCLPSLKRTVYAIHNPRFYSGRVWAGGIPAMAKIYLELIRSVVPSGRLILGGWSLGGLIALEIASLLSQSAEFDLLGLVMMDSICPQALKQHQSHDIVPHGTWTTSRCRPEISLLISAQLKASAKMVEDWTMPSWSQPRIPAQDWTRITALERLRKGFSSTSSSSPSSSPSPTPSSRNRTRWSGTTALTIHPFDDGIEDKSSPELVSENSEEHRSHSLVNADSPPPPPTILLRCKEYAPVSKSKNPNAISKVDITRAHRLLGWDEYNPDLIKYVLDIPGHHFSLFAEQNIQKTGTRIIEACEFLEGMDMRDGYKNGAVDYF